jgi:nucleoid-associated protein YgaU
MKTVDKSTIGLKRTDMANMFNAYNDGSNTFFYMGRTLTFGNIEKLNEKYVIKHRWEDEDTWYRLAHNYYDNAKLWWIICRANNIKNPFDTVDSGTIINIPNKSIMQSVINKISA